jgi:hypothetical protein
MPLAIQNAADSGNEKERKAEPACANFAHAIQQLADYVLQSTPSIIGATDSLCACFIGISLARSKR